MVRDPRDVVVSRHRASPDHFWSDLEWIKVRVRLFNKAISHPRFISIRYEDLVANPDEVQATLMRKIGFLRKKAAFSDFAKVARPSESAVRALGGVRDISTESIARWRGELARLLGQIKKFGPIDGVMQDLGYDLEGDWDSVFDGVEPDMEPGFWEGIRKRRSLYRTVRSSVVRWPLRLRFLLGFPERSDKDLVRPPNADAAPAKEL